MVYDGEKEGLIDVAGVEEAKLALEKESVVLPASEATPATIIDSTKRIFSKGYKGVELIGKVGDAQICFIELMDTDGATNFDELGEDIKLNLMNDSALIEDGMIADSATVQATNPKSWDRLSGWIRVDNDYFNIKDEENMPPSKQIEALLEAGMAIAESLDGQGKLDLILRPTELHTALLKALMEARGVEMRRIEQNEIIGN
ncbi:MAG: hypothetical protein K6T91_05995 [Firmicutes bacterium]|nr:hypothetical protein [Bacillota bacterium]